MEKLPIQTNEFWTVLQYPSSYMIVNTEHLPRRLWDNLKKHRSGSINGWWEKNIYKVCEQRENVDKKNTYTEKFQWFVFYGLSTICRLLKHILNRTNIFCLMNIGLTISGENYLFFQICQFYSTYRRGRKDGSILFSRVFARK